MASSSVHRVLARGSAVALLGLCLCACGGGSSGSNAGSVSPVSQNAVTPGLVAGANAYGTIIIAVPPTTASASRTARHATYVSPATTRAAVFIDGATAPAGSTTSCTSSSCSIMWSAALTVPAVHSFAVETDNGTNVLAEGVRTYAITFGNNNGATVTLNGVAASAAWSAESCVTPTTTCTGTLTVSDAAGAPIVNTSTPLSTGFDNGPLTFGSTAPGTGTVTAGGTLTQPSAAGTAAYTVHCIVSTGGFLTSLTPSITTGSGAITGAELTARSLI